MQSTAVTSMHDCPNGLQQSQTGTAARNSQLLQSVIVATPLYSHACNTDHEICTTVVSAVLYALTHCDPDLSYGR